MIVFAYQSWNDHFNYYTPNTHPSDWIIDGVKTVPLTHGGQYFTWESMKYDYSLIDKLSVDELIDMGVAVVKSTYLDSLPDFVSHKLLKDIPLGEKYIYPVPVSQVRYFIQNRNHGFKFVDPRVIDDVKNGLAKIVIMFPYEGHSGMAHGVQVNESALIVDEWAKAAGFSKDHVYFIHGNLLADEFNSQVTNYTSMSVDAFTMWVPKSYLLESEETNAISPRGVPLFSPQDEKYLYLCYNRTIREHRYISLAYLADRNLINKGLVSCGSKLWSNVTEFYLRSHGLDNMLHTAPYLESITPILLEMDLVVNNPAIDINVEHYERTFISLISETHWEEGTLFRSEKIWKTLAVGHPFMVISSPGFLKSLKKRGFKTFNRWIDESYDSEPNWIKRSAMIVDEIKRLEGLGIDRLKQIREEMHDTLAHNMKLYREIFKQDFAYNGSRPLFDKVKEVWDSF